jgi:hypothetical protein
MTSQLFWFTARASGIVAWALLAAGVLWGLALSTRALGSRPRPNWLLDLHRFLGAAGVVFTGVHVVSLVADNYVHFGLTQVLVPLASSWHPVAVAWGITSMYLLLAVEVTSLLRKHLSRRFWRATHLLSFPLFATATVHLLSAGTDRRNLVLRLAVVLATVAVVALTVLRLTAESRRPGPASRRRAVPRPGGPPRPTAPARPAVTPAAVGRDRRSTAAVRRPPATTAVERGPRAPTSHGGWPLAPPSAPPAVGPAGHGRP